MTGFPAPTHAELSARYDESDSEGETPTIDEQSVEPRAVLAEGQITESAPVLGDSIPQEVSEGGFDREGVPLEAEYSEDDDDEEELMQAMDWADLHDGELYSTGSTALGYSCTADFYEVNLAVTQEGRQRLS